MVIPAQLVALGVSLLELKTGGIARSSFLGLFRLAMGVGVGFLIADAFGLEGAARAIVIIQSAMPVAVSSYLYNNTNASRRGGRYGRCLTAASRDPATFARVL